MKSALVWTWCIWPLINLCGFESSGPDDVPEEVEQLKAP